jgi:hypothetical protein
MGKYTLTGSGSRKVSFSVGFDEHEAGSPEVKRFHADLKKLIRKHKLKVRRKKRK